MEGRFSDRPDPEHGNPLKPVRTRGNADKNLANAIVAEFRRISSADFLWFLRFFSANPQLHLTTNTISIEFYVASHKTSFANLGWPLFVSQYI